MDRCCCAPTMPKTMPKPALKPAAPAFRRYRRSRVCRAPRKRLFIANMEKFVVELELPSGLAGESFFGASTLCTIATPCCGLPQAASAPLSPLAILAGGNGGNNGGSGSGSDFLGGSGDDSSDMSDQLSALPVAVALALCAALYPFLERLAPSADALSAPKADMAAAPQAEEELDFDAMHEAISAALLGAEPRTEAGTSEELAEGKLVAQLA